MEKCIIVENTGDHGWVYHSDVWRTCEYCGKAQTRDRVISFTGWKDDRPDVMKW